MSEKRNALIVPVAIAVLAVWVGSAFFSFYSQEYTALTISTPVMLVLAGYVFGFRQVAKNTNGNGSANGGKNE